MTTSEAPSVNLLLYTNSAIFKLTYNLNYLVLLLRLTHIAIQVPKLACMPILLYSQIKVIRYILSIRQDLNSQKPSGWKLDVHHQLHH